MEAVRHVTAHILASDAEFNIALRQVDAEIANSARHKSDSRFHSPLQPLVFHIAVTSPNRVILVGFLQEALLLLLLVQMI